MAGKDKSKFRQFIDKAAKYIPEASNVIGTMVTGNYVGAVTQLGGIFKKEIEAGGKRAEKAKELSIELELNQNQFILEKFREEEKSRQRASENSKPETNSKLQVVTAYFALIGFVLFAAANFYLMYVSMTKPNVKIGPFIISSMAYYQGVFTGLLFTLKDYLFGGSFSNTEKNVQKIDYNSFSENEEIEDK